MTPHLKDIPAHQFWGAPPWIPRHLPLGAAPRPATADDFPVLLEILRAALEPVLAPLGLWNQTAEDKAFRRSFHPGADYIIEREGRGIGLWGVRQTPSTGGSLFLIHAAIAPGFQGAGLGRALLSRLVVWADQTGRVVELTVHRGNRATLFYQSAGFRPVIETDTKVRLRYSPDLRQ